MLQSLHARAINVCSHPVIKMKTKTSAKISEFLPKRGAALLKDINIFIYDTDNYLTYFTELGL